MNLRRTVRRTIQQGNSIFATVEEIHNGQVTVRLATQGARLTNLAFLGETIEIGQRVIVDYAAGSPPVVRPILTPEEVVRPVVLAEDKSETPDLNLDIGARLSNFGEIYYPLSDGVPQIVTWLVANEDTNNFHSGGSYGSQNIVIRKGGKYIIEMIWFENPFQGAPVGTDWGKGFYEIQLLNNNVPFAIYRAPSWAAPYEEMPTYLITLNLFQSGDILTVRLLAQVGLQNLETNYSEYWPDLNVHWIPGTNADLIVHSSRSGYVEGI